MSNKNLLRKIHANFATGIFTQFSCVETSNTVTKDMAESSLMTLTERGQNQLKDEATKCKNILVTHKELLKGNIERFKLSIRTFHSLEENGLSTQQISLEIGSAHNNLRADLEALVEKWSQFIRLAVRAKNP